MSNCDEGHLDYFDLINAVKRKIIESKVILNEAIHKNQKVIAIWQKIISKLKVDEGKFNYVAEGFKAKVSRLEQENIFNQLQVDRADRMLAMTDDYQFEFREIDPSSVSVGYRMNPDLVRHFTFDPRN